MRRFQLSILWEEHPEQPVHRCSSLCVTVLKKETIFFNTWITVIIPILYTATSCHITYPIKCKINDPPWNTAKHTTHANTQVYTAVNNPHFQEPDSLAIAVTVAIQGK